MMRNSWLARFGFLRLALLALALINMLIPLFDMLLSTAASAAGERSLWDVFATYIAPVLAPLLTVVIFFDYVMSRVRAADAEGDASRQFRIIGRTELAVIGITLLFWVPFFYILMT